MTVNDGDETTMGGRIMLLRSELGYSRECLAEIVGISAKFLYEIETDRKGFSAQILMRLAKALGVTSDYIITGGYEIFSVRACDWIWNSMNRGRFDKSIVY